jgi:Glycosyltransferase family 87
MGSARLARLGRAALPIVAIVCFVVVVGSILAAAGDTLGFDFLAYHQAAVRVLDGQPLYDMSFATTGGFGLFYYPPTFAPFILPFGLLPAAVAVDVWIVVLLVSFGVGVAILPVSQTIRWWVVLLAGLSWPFAYAVKLGQVGPILFLLFAIGWRWLDEPVRLGVSMALGAAIKVQPGILFVWAIITRRWTAVLVGGVALAVLVIVSTLIVGLGAWTDFVTLVRQVGDPITTVHNFTPGAVAYQLGVPADVASIIQLVSTIAVVGAVLLSARYATAESSYLAAVIASQLLSPILWDHYALILLLPVAYLLAAGRWWALAIPLVTSTPLAGITPPAVYPIVFFVTLAATIWVGLAGRGRLGRDQPIRQRA